MTTDHEVFLENEQTVSQIPVPHATLILILGIASIIGCCFYGSGSIAAIVALVLSSRANKQYAANPERYLKKSYSNMHAGKVCAIVGLILSALAAIYFIWLVSFFGWDAINDSELMQERLQEMMPR